MTQEKNTEHNDSQEVYVQLPSPDVLEEYERIAPGTTKNLLRMAALEQKHRHAWEDAYLIRQTKNYRTGQLFGFIAAFVVILLSSVLAVTDRMEAATIVIIPGLFFLLMVSIVTYVPMRYKVQSEKRKKGNE